MPNQHVDLEMWEKIAHPNAAVSFSNLPAANSLPVGTEFLIAEFGGLKMITNGVDWKPVNGAAVIWTQLADVSTVANNNEQILKIIDIPAGFLNVGCVVRYTCGHSKVGTAGSHECRLRIGNSGSISDTLVHSSSILFTNNISCGSTQAFRVESVTSTRQLGSGAAGANAMATSNPTTTRAAVTILNISNALKLSLSMVDVSGLNEASTLYGAVVEIMFP